MGRLDECRGDRRFDDAKQMSSFQPMLDLAARFASVEGVSFVRPISNFAELWQWGDATGA